MTIIKESYKNKIQELYQDLKIDRDEVRLKLNLAKLEISEQWNETEIKWKQFRAKSGAIEKSLGKAGSDIEHGLVELGKEIKHAYDDIKKGIKSSKLTK